jgi:N-acetylglucosaminyldiphosphoundecaprenol N-acetyl-beta-D-mannosaminyltransferase
MLVGEKKRAPRWAQRCGAEWVFRAVQEPRRLGARYAKDAAVFGPRLIASLRQLRRHRNGPGLQMRLDDGPSGQARCVTVTIAADAPVQHDASLRRLVAERVREGARLAVSFSGGVPNPGALGELIGLMRLARTSGAEANVSDIAPPTRDALIELDVPRWVTDGFGSTRP